MGTKLISARLVARTSLLYTYGTITKISMDLQCHWHAQYGDPTYQISLPSGLVGI